MEELLEERVGSIEENLNRFILHTDKSLYRLAKSLDILQLEMKEFKDEMREFKDEMKEFKDESSRENKEFKREMNKKWGDLSNKLGSFAEDIAAPNIPRIAKEYFQEKTILRYVPGIRIRHPFRTDEDYEFDAIVEGESKVFLLETKYTVRDKYIETLPTLIQNFKECFPEYEAKELVVIFGSMSLHENTVKRLTRMGIYAMAMGDDTMDLVNFEAVQKKKKK